MSMNSTGMMGDGARETGSTDSVTDAPLMAATPIWETRGKKRRGRGGLSNASASDLAAAPASTAAVAAEPRSFDSAMDRPISETRPMTEPSLGSTAMADPMNGRPDMTADHARDADDAGLVAPIGRSRPQSSRRGGAPVAAIAAGAVALVSVGAAGWYATRSNDGVAELTPGAPQESLAIAAAPTAPAPPLAPAMNPSATAQGATAAPAATTAATTERRATVRTASVSRVRPAAAAPAASATEAGIDASGTASLPGGPQPYSTLSPGAATDSATTGASGVTTAPSVTPAPIPSTPPIASDPAPATASPAAPEPSTPPSTAAPQ